MAGTDLSGMGIGQSSRPGLQPEQQQVAPKFDATNVNDQLNSTLNSNSLLMRVARTNGQATAAQRGLGNSSIGAESAQRAMVDAALPIAQQNAQQAQQLTMQQNDFGNQTNQANLNAKLTQDRDKLLYQQNLGTLDKEGQQRLKELDTQLKNQTTLNNQQNAFNSAEAAKDRQQQLTMLEKQFGQETATLAQQVVANTHGMYMSTVDKAVSSYNDRYAAVMADNTMKAADKEKLVNNMKTELNSTLTMYQQMYSNISTIKPDWTKFPSASLPGVNVK